MMRGAEVVTGRRPESKSNDSCGTVSASIGLTQTTAGNDTDYAPHLSEGCDSAGLAQHWREVGMRGADVVTGRRHESNGFSYLGQGIGSC